MVQHDALLLHNRKCFVAHPILPNHHNQHSPTTRTCTKESICTTQYTKRKFLDLSVHTTSPLAIQTPLLVKCRILAATAALICEGRRQRRVLAMDVIVKSFVGEQDEERDTKS